MRPVMNMSARDTHVAGSVVDVHINAPQVGRWMVGKAARVSCVYAREEEPRGARCI